MREITINKLSLEFFPMTEVCTVEEMQNYIWTLYDLAMNSESSEGIRKYIPSKFDIMNASWEFFTDHYIQYALSGGGDQASSRDIRRYCENGMDYDEVYSIISDMRESNASYNTYMEMDGEAEKKSLRDIQKLLKFFNISYFNDDSEGFFLNELDVKDWVNPPFLKVW